MRAEEFENPKEKFVDMFQKFLPLAMKIIGLDSLPKMVFEKEIDSPEQPTFGQYVNNEHILHVGLVNRHPNDILRTVAHELVHYKQDINNELNNDSGITGSPEENEANQLAGIVMRNFNKRYPEFLKGKPVVSESVAEARGLAPVNPYIELMQSLGWFMSMNTAKIQQDAVDSAAQQELKIMQQQFNKPIINGKSFADILSDNTMLKHPKVAPALLKFAYDILGYIEPRIKRYIRPDLQAKWMASLSKLKDQYRAAIQFTSGQQGVAEGSLSEKINPKTLTRGFVQEKDMGWYTLQAVGDVASRMANEPPTMEIYAMLKPEAGKRRGTQIGQLSLKIAHGIYLRDNPGVEALVASGVDVDTAYQRKGVASAMYAFAKELGNDVIASVDQSDDAKAMWTGMQAKGVAEGLEDQFKFELDLDQDRLYVYDQQGGPAGRIEFYNPDPSDTKTIDIALIVVRPQYQRQGLASAMYRYLEKQGYKILRPTELTPDGEKFFGKIKPQGVAENFANGIDQLTDLVWQAVSEQPMDEAYLTEIDPGMLTNLYAVFPTLSRIIINNALQKASKEAKETSIMVNVMKKHASGEPVTSEENTSMLSQIKDLLAYGGAAVMGVLAGPGIAIAATYKKELLELLKTKGPGVLLSIIRDKGKLDVVKLLIAKLLGKNALPFYPAIKKDNQQVGENFADGKNPQDKGDSARHGIRKGISLAQLKKVRSSDSASPRKKQLAHWQINMRQGKQSNEGIGDKHTDIAPNKEFVSNKFYVKFVNDAMLIYDSGELVYKKNGNYSSPTRGDVSIAKRITTYLWQKKHDPVYKK